MISAAKQMPYVKFRPDRSQCGKTLHYQVNSKSKPEASYASLYRASDSYFEACLFRDNQYNEINTFVAFEICWSNCKVKSLNIDQGNYLNEQNKLAPINAVYYEKDQTLEFFHNEQCHDIRIAQIPFFFLSYALFDLNVFLPHLQNPYRPFPLQLISIHKITNKQNNPEICTSIKIANCQFIKMIGHGKTTVDLYHITNEEDQILAEFQYDDQNHQIVYLNYQNPDKPHLECFEINLLSTEIIPHRDWAGRNFNSKTRYIKNS